MRLAALLSLVVLAATSADSHGAQAGAEGWSGKAGQSWHWLLPETPNGLKPNQSWHATASTPDGATYVAGMDHRTNAALYRIEHASGRLAYVGDAKAASQAARNWTAGETVEKFHTRPLWHAGRVYVASMNRSSMDDAYLRVRGFHWYAHDPARKTFLDLSAAEPGGVGAEHGNIVATASDPVRNVIYGAGVPTGEIFRFNVSAGRTEKLGRPKAFDRPYLYAGRAMFVDGRGRLYFTAGNPRHGRYDTGPYAHLHFYDPQTGFGERRDWQLEQPRALEAGQCFAGGRRCYFTDDAGHLYVFDDEGPTWKSLGKLELGDPWAFVWMFQVSPDETSVVVATSLGKNPSGLYMHTIANKETKRLIDMRHLDPALSGYEIHTGSDAWDEQGRFYFASSGSRGVIVTRMDWQALRTLANAAPDQ